MHYRKFNKNTHKIEDLVDDDFISDSCHHNFSEATCIKSNPHLFLSNGLLYKSYYPNTVNEQIISIDMKQSYNWNIENGWDYPDMNLGSQRYIGMPEFNEDEISSFYESIYGVEYKAILDELDRFKTLLKSDSKVSDVLSLGLFDDSEKDETFNSKVPFEFRLDLKKDTYSIKSILDILGVNLDRYYEFYNYYKDIRFDKEESQDEFLDVFFGFLHSYKRGCYVCDNEDDNFISYTTDSFKLESINNKVTIKSVIDALGINENKYFETYKSIESILLEDDKSNSNLSLLVLGFII
jgi:hypothetical protein